MSAPASIGADAGARGDWEIERALADWVSALAFDTLPAPVRVRAEDHLLDAIGSAFAGRTQELVARVEAPARAFAGGGRSTVIGGSPASPAAAVFQNAYAITSATLCDVYRPGLCHVTPVALPPLLALAEERGSSWGELVTALAAAAEVTVRLASGLDYEHMRSRGWHMPGVVGPAGAAAGAARLLGLDPAGVASALAHGAAQGAGTFAALGTEAVKFNQARGSVSGLLAALMGEAGLRAAPRWLTHTDGGMAHTYSHGRDPELVVAGLGERWELEQVSLRRWPAASSVQSLIEVCLELFAEEGRGRDGVAHVHVELGPAAFEVSGLRGWGDPLSAQQSARWVVACVLEDRDWWLEASSPRRLADRGLSAFAAERVTVSQAPELGQAGVRVRVGLADGGELAASRDDAPGDPSRPLSRARIEEKLRRAALDCGRADGGEEQIAFVRAATAATPVAGLVQGLGAG
jgi:2-methylcitrate dehydratase PrpD